MSDKKEETQRVDGISKETKQDTAGKAPAAKTDAKPEAKAPRRSKEDLKASKSWVLGYAKREWVSICFGMLFLVGGMLSDLTIPLFIGRVIDHSRKQEWDDIGTLCLYMCIVIVVSFAVSELFKFVAPINYSNTDH